jgi:hypothetical protein
MRFPTRPVSDLGQPCVKEIFRQIFFRQRQFMKDLRFLGIGKAAALLVAPPGLSLKTRAT